MSKLILRVEVLAGTHVKQAIYEMMNLRKYLGLSIAADFNGEEVFVCRDDQTVESLEGEFDKVRRNNVSM